MCCRRYVEGRNRAFATFSKLAGARFLARPEGALKLEFEVRIHDVVARPLRVNRDESGSLVEILRADWTDIYDDHRRPFAQTYFSVTPPGAARDEDVWHVHSHQEDRFSVAAGTIVLALWDGRAESPTHGVLNLLTLGEAMPDTKQHCVLIPRRVHHGFLVVSRTPAILHNSPTRLYDPTDEGRESFSDVGATFEDGLGFSWQAVRERLTAANA